MQRRPLLLAAPGLLAAPRLGIGQAVWPSRPVRILNPYAPGGTSDIIIRPLAERLAARFGQPFIIENRAGAGGTVGTAAAAAERPDGHTLLISNTGPLAVAPSLFPSLAYDPARAFAWIALLGGARDPGRTGRARKAGASRRGAARHALAGGDCGLRGAGSRALGQGGAECRRAARLMSGSRGDYGGRWGRPQMRRP